MLFIVIVSIASALSFGAAARKKGYDSPRFWVYPLAAGSVLCLAASAAGLVVRMLVKDESSVFLRAYPYVVSAMCIALLCVLISKAWRQIKAMPQNEKTSPQQTDKS